MSELGGWILAVFVAAFLAWFFYVTWFRPQRWAGRSWWAIGVGFAMLCIFELLATAAQRR